MEIVLGIFFAILLIAILSHAFEEDYDTEDYFEIDEE